MKNVLALHAANVQEQVQGYDRLQSDPVRARVTGIGNCAAKAALFCKQITEAGALIWDSLYSLYHPDHGKMDDFQNVWTGSWSKKPAIKHISTIVADENIWAVDFDLDRSGYWIEPRDEDDGVGGHLERTADGQLTLPSDGSLEGWRLLPAREGLVRYLGELGIAFSWDMLDETHGTGSEADQVTFDEDF